MVCSLVFCLWNGCAMFVPLLIRCLFQRDYHCYFLCVETNVLTMEISVRFLLCLPFLCALVRYFVVNFSCNSCSLLFTQKKTTRKCRNQELLITIQTGCTLFLVLFSLENHFREINLLFGVLSITFSPSIWRYNDHQRNRVAERSEKNADQFFSLWCDQVPQMSAANIPIEFSICWYIPFGVKLKCFACYYISI